MVKMGKNVDKYNPIRLEDHVDFETKSNHKKAMEVIEKREKNAASKTY